MCNTTWVCFNCRRAQRRAASFGAADVRVVDVGRSSPDVRCAGCNQACVELGRKIELPPKRDAVAWRKLRDDFTRHRVESAVGSALIRTCEQHARERRILALAARPDTPGRGEIIRSLAKTATR